MAYAHLDQRGIILPAPAFRPIDLRALVVPLHHPLPPPYPTVAYFAVPFLPAPPLVVGGAPVRLGVNLGVLARIDQMRTQSLLQFMADEGLVPSPEEEMKRAHVILQLKKIVMVWIKKVAWQRRLPKELIASASATILTYGSYGLGVHGSESDIDALCVGPCYATMEEDFFIVLRKMLESRPEVTEVHCVKSAKVPLMRFKFNGISIDFPYAQLNAISVPDNVDLSDPSVLKIDETSWRSLSGVRANKHILELVPNLKNFQAMLRCIKLWARRRGVYSHLLGFLGGIHLAILAAYVCCRFPNATISSLVSIFFDTFLHWPWPEPVAMQDTPLHPVRPDGRSIMPIMLPCSPYDWCNSNVTESTFIKINAEFRRGYALTRDLKPNFDWCSLFEPFPYTRRYAYFMRIFLAAPDGDELQDWLGWVKSRFRALLLKLEEVQGYCDPNPTEYVDHEVAEPNIVFYWGLSSNGGNLIDIDNVKQDFMKSVDKDLHGGYEGSCYKLKLSIVESSQLPKDVQFDSTSMKGSKAFWRILDYNHLRKPIYSQHSPDYFVGYVATDRGFPSAVS